MILPRPVKVVYMPGVVSGFSLRNCNTAEDESTANPGLLYLSGTNQGQIDLDKLSENLT